jgi:hypothetical protein
MRVFLGPRSRFGARYFEAYLAADAALSPRPVISGLHNSGPLVTYNWIEVAETQTSAAVGGRRVDLSEAQLLSPLLALLPPGGHLMVEYDSPQRAVTARALAAGVPAIATPLGAVLFTIGCGARFKDWQIAEGGSEGPRKLQGYRPPSDEIAARWRREAAEQLDAFLARPAPFSQPVAAARARAESLLSRLRA